MNTKNATTQKLYSELYCTYLGLFELREQLYQQRDFLVWESEDTKEIDVDISHLTSEISSINSQLSELD